MPLSQVLICGQFCTCMSLGQKTLVVQITGTISQSLCISTERGRSRVGCHFSNKLKIDCTAQFKVTEFLNNYFLVLYLIIKPWLKNLHF